jgi:hypothetical protein
LELKDYDVNKQGGSLVIRATYSCPACTKRVSGILRFVKRKFVSLWQDTKAMELGVGNFKARYEKRTPTG